MLSNKMAEKRKYKYEELLERVEWGDWIRSIKKYVHNMPLENDLNVAPEYGYIVDKIRQKYNIFLSVLPVNLEEINRPPIQKFRYNGTMMVMNKNARIDKEYIIADDTFPKTMRRIINIAIEYIKLMESKNIKLGEKDSPTYEEFYQLMEELTDLRNNQGLYNVDSNLPKEGGGFYTKEEARQIIPEEIKKPGLIIVYKLSERKAISEQFIGESLEEWNKSENWTKILEESDFIEFGKDKVRLSYVGDIED